MHNYHHHSRHFANKEIVEMFFFQVLKEVAFGLISIFIPVYLLVQGIPLYQILGIYTLRSVVHGVVAYYLAERVLIGAGIKHTFSITTLLFVASFLIIEQGVSAWYLVAWILLDGAANGLYASAHHSFLSINVDKRSAGGEVAFLAILSTLVGIATPFIGAVVISIFGFKHILLVGSCVLLASTIPLFMSKETDVSNQVIVKGFRAVRMYWKEKNNLFWSSAGNGLVGSGHPLWDSLYLFRLLGGIRYLGALRSVMSFLQILANYMGGRRSDNHQSAFSVGINGSILSRILTFAAFHPYVAIMTESLNSAIRPLFATAYHSSFYRQLKGPYAISMVIGHEVAWHTSNVIAGIIITISAFYIGWYSFLVAAVFMLLGDIINRKQGVGLK